MARAKHDGTYEYRTSSNPNSYVMGEEILEGHKFYYIKRRSMRFQSRYTGFKTKCKCKFKFETWWANKDLALREYNEHVKQEKLRTPTIFSGITNEM